MTMTEVTRPSRKKISITVDDLRQVFVIAGNEMRKFIRGKKILLYVLLMALFVALLVGFPIAYPDNFGTFMNNPDNVLFTYASNVTFLILIGAVLFASYTIVSEFEERTYLLLFTRPVKKTSIFVGKFLASYAVVLVTMLIFYGISAIHSFALAGGVSSKIWESFLISLFYGFAVSSIAILLSTISKKGSVSALMSFFIILIVPQIVWALFVITNPMLMNPSTPFSYELENYWYFINVAGSSVSQVAIESISISLPIVSLSLWGIVPLVAAWLIFLKKEV